MIVHGSCDSGRLEPMSDLSDRTWRVHDQRSVKLPERNNSMQRSLYQSTIHRGFYIRFETGLSIWLSDEIITIYSRTHIQHNSIICASVSISAIVVSNSSIGLVG